MLRSFSLHGQFSDSDDPISIITGIAVTKLCNIPDFKWVILGWVSFSRLRQVGRGHFKSTLRVGRSGQFRFTLKL